MLKATIAKLEDVEERYRDLYRQEGDKFVLEVDSAGGGGDPELKKKINEFRQTNIDQQKKIAALETAVSEMRELYKDIDPDEARKAAAALDKINELEERDLIKAGKIDEVVSRRMAAQRTDLENKLKAEQKKVEQLSADRDTFHKRVASMTREKEVLKGISEVAQIRESAKEDILLRAERVWQLKDDKLVALDADGNEIFGKDTQPITLKEWGQQLMETSPHLFEEARGGGSRGTQKTTTQGKRVLRSSDPYEFGRNLAEIAKGDVVVQPD